MRATVKGSFAYPRGGTAIALESVEGTIKPGEVVALTLATRRVEVVVRGVGFADHDIGRPTFHADLVILVDGVEPNEVPPGTGVLSSR